MGKILRYELVKEWGFIIDFLPNSIISELLIPVIKNNNLHGFIRKTKSRDRSLEESPARDPPRRTGKQKIAPQFIVG